jgi:cytochrome c5
MADNGIGVIRRSRRDFLKIGCYTSLLFCASLCFSSLVYGQEERGPALPDGDGKQLVTLVCSQCHGLRETQILRDGQKGWEEVVDRMVLYGAQLSPSEGDLVIRYLATQLGPGTRLVQKGAVPPQHALGERTMKISLPEGPGKELVAARCALCHDLEKVVSSTRSKADWESITINMVQRGMQSTPDEMQKMMSYLQANFGK